MPKRRALYKSSPESVSKKSREEEEAEAEDVVIEMVHNTGETEGAVTDEEDERLQQLSSADEAESPIHNSLSSASRLLRGGSNSRHVPQPAAQAFSSSLDAALRRAAVLERRAAREEREEEAMRAAADALKADEDADAAAAEAEAEAEAIAVAEAQEAARAARIGAGGRRRISELAVAEMMADGRLAEPDRMHMIGSDRGELNVSRQSRDGVEFVPPLDIAPCPVDDVDVRLRKYVRSDGRQLSHTPVALAARQNRQKRKEYVKKMEIAYANMQFETQYLRERMSRLQQELKWYKDRWAEHATKCPLLHVGRRNLLLKNSVVNMSEVVDEGLTATELNAAK